MPSLFELFQMMTLNFEEISPAVSFPPLSCIIISLLIGTDNAAKVSFRPIFPPVKLSKCIGRLSSHWSNSQRRRLPMPSWIESFTTPIPLKSNPQIRNIKLPFVRFTGWLVRQPSKTGSQLRSSGSGRPEWWLSATGSAALGDRNTQIGAVRPNLLLYYFYIQFC